MDFDCFDFIFVGVVVGIVVAFGAFIGGVLFLLEEVSMFWRESMMCCVLFLVSIVIFVFVLVCVVFLEGLVVLEYM